MSNERQLLFLPVGSIPNVTIVRAKRGKGEGGAGLQWSGQGGSSWWLKVRWEDSQLLVGAKRLLFARAWAIEEDDRQMVGCFGRPTC